MTARVRKAVFPVAGFGTRFLPATKAQPKELLPLVDKPVIQYVVEEAAHDRVDAGEHRAHAFVGGEHGRGPAAVLPGQHGAAVHEHRRQVEPHHRHHHPGQGLVAAGQPQQGQQQMLAIHLLM